MRIATLSASALFVCSLLCGLAGMAGASVTSELTVHKVVKDKDGKETLVSAETAKPGEILQYTVTYGVTQLCHIGIITTIVQVASLPLSAQNESYATTNGLTYYTHMHTQLSLVRPTRNESRVIWRR